jgi:malonyl-CoA O-methyltransferase
VVNKNLLKRELKRMNLSKNMLWSPLEYVDAAVIADEAANEMLTRLEWMTFVPKTILDIGCGAGLISPKLQARYPNAQLLAIDISQPMLNYAKQFVSACVCADATNLPLPDQCVDIIFANFLLPWCTEMKTLFQEWHRVLTPEGLLMVSALGPDTLMEGGKKIQDQLIPQCVDMHDLGDALLAEGFTDPVLDVSYYVTNHSDFNKLRRELDASGMLSQSSLETNDMTPAEDSTWNMTYEVIYAHAFASAHLPATEGVTKVPLAELRKTLKGRVS